jgi:hypothetical protein
MWRNIYSISASHSSSTYGASIWSPFSSP